MRRNPAPSDHLPNPDQAAPAATRRRFPDDSDLALLGRISKPHALGGEVRVIPDSDDAAVWETALDSPLFLTLPSSEELRPVRLESIHPHGPLLLVRIEGVNDRTEAEALHGAQIWIPRGALPQLEEDSYYHYDLIGLEVADEATGLALGRILSINEQGAQDQLVVQRPDGRDFMIPFIGAFVGAVDLKAGRLEVHLPPGLMELNDKPERNEAE